MYAALSHAADGLSRLSGGPLAAELHRLLEESRVLQFIPVNESCLDDASLMYLLTKWRAENMEAFPTYFQPTPTRTRGWLAERVLGRQGRALFLLSSGGQMVGQVGTIVGGDDISSAEITDVIRGGSGLPRGGMREAMSMLMRCLYRAGIETLRLRVFIENLPAIRLYHQVGFVPDKLLPLVRQDGAPGEHAWIDAGTNPPERFMLQMRHTRGRDLGPPRG